MDNENWYIHKTECYPNSFKINHSPTDKYAGNNSFVNFFPTQDKAQAEIDRRINNHEKRM